MNHPSAVRGRLIAIETPHGAHGAELADLVTQQLTNSVHTPLCTAQPSHTPLGSLIRRHHHRLTGHALALAMAADSSEHTHAEITPHLDAGHDVICHGYTAASMVTNALISGVPMETTFTYHRHLPCPDITIYIHEAPHALHRRLHWPNYPSEAISPQDPHQQLALFTQARQLLHQYGWQHQYRIDYRDHSLRSTACDITQLIHGFGEPCTTAPGDLAPSRRFVR